MQDWQKDPDSWILLDRTPTSTVNQHGSRYLIFHSILLKLGFKELYSPSAGPSITKNFHFKTVALWGKFHWHSILIAKPVMLWYYTLCVYIYTTGFTGGISVPNLWCGHPCLPHGNGGHQGAGWRHRHHCSTAFYCLGAPPPNHWARRRLWSIQVGSLFCIMKQYCQSSVVIS